MKNRTGAFTLAELLVALAITTVLATLLISVASATMSVWQRGMSQIDTFATARQSLLRIADELKGATASNQVEFSENVLTAAFQSGGPSPTPNPQPTPQAGKSENLFFVAPYPNVGAGDLCVIAYRHIDIDTSSNGANSHTLQRAFVDSSASMSGGTTPTPSPAAAVNRYQSSGYSNLDWRTVARGVLEFEIQSYSQQDLDTDATPANTWNSVSGATTMLGNTPRRVVVRIKVIDEKSIARLNAVPFNPTDLNSPYNRIISQSAREFRTEVDLPPPH